MMVAMTDQVELSVVIPVFNEEINIVPMYDRLLAALSDKVSSLEILYVDDGSADMSWEVISELAGRDERVQGVRFARNFGHQAALTAGVDAAHGRAVGIIDSSPRRRPFTVSCAASPTWTSRWTPGTFD